jgi:hypothetical protein
LEKIYAVELDFPGHDSARRARDQSENRECRHALSTTGLTDDANGLALVHMEIDAVDGRRFPFLGVEYRTEPSNLQ